MSDDTRQRDPTDPMADDTNMSDDTSMRDEPSADEDVAGTM